MRNNWKKYGLMGASLRWLMALSLMFFANFAYSASKTVLVLGDSLSAEYGIARGSGWVSLLERRLQSEDIDARIVNASVSGETTSGGRTRLPSLLGQHHPHTVVIELGGNDGLRGLPVPQTQSNLDAMIDAAKKAGAKVLLVGMQIPPNYGRAYADSFAGMYGDLARRYKVALAPFMLEGVAQDVNKFQADRIHPLASAHPTILNNIWPHLAPLLK